MKIKHIQKAKKKKNQNLVGCSSNVLLKQFWKETIEVEDEMYEHFLWWSEAAWVPGLTFPFSVNTYDLTQASGVGDVGDTAPGKSRGEDKVTDDTPTECWHVSKLYFSFVFRSNMRPLGTRRTRSHFPAKTWENLHKTKQHYHMCPTACVLSAVFSLF